MKKRFLVLEVQVHGGGREASCSGHHSDRGCLELGFRGRTRLAHESTPLRKIDFHFMCVGICLLACGVCRSHKKASDSLELELQTLLCCRVCAQNQTLVLCKSSWCSEALSHFSSSLTTTIQLGANPIP